MSNDFKDAVFDAVAPYRQQQEVLVAALRSIYETTFEATTHVTAAMALKLTGFVPKPPNEDALRDIAVLSDAVKAALKGSEDAV